MNDHIMDEVINVGYSAGKVDIVWHIRLHPLPMDWRCCRLSDVRPISAGIQWSNDAIDSVIILINVRLLSDRLRSTLKPALRRRAPLLVGCIGTICI